MATVKETLKNWFKTNLKPTQEQFWAWMDSYHHKDEMIPIDAVDGLEGLLDEKADAEALTNHLTDANAHAELFDEQGERIAALEAKTDDQNNWKTIPNPGYTFNAGTRVLTMAAGWEGIINGIEYTNAALQVFPAIALSDAGYSRIEMVVFHTDGTFEKRVGAQSTTTPVAPTLPPNTLEAMFLTVGDGVVTVPVNPKAKAPVTSVNGERGDVILNIINDLVTGGIYDFLSAEQGKVLKTQINSINTLLSSDNVNLDNVQELVDAIETVQTSLSTILVNDLTTGGTTKALTAEMGKSLKTLLDNKVDKVAGERLINAAEITKLAGVTNVTTTVKTITSASLATQDIAGFVTYINALAVVLVVGANEIVEYQLSDTGRLFKLLLRGRSFGVGQAAIVAADVEEITLWMAKDLKFGNYPSTRNDGVMPTNKILSTDANGALKLYTMAAMPAPYLEVLIPDSTLPSTTTNFVLKGAFFTPTMTVAITGQTINYITFVSDNEVKVNVTTGAAEGSFTVTLNNGISATFPNALLIVLGTIFSPITSEWEAPTGNVSAVEDDVTINIYDVSGSNRWSRPFDHTRNFRVRFRLSKSPFGNTGISEVVKQIQLVKSSDNAMVFGFNLRRDAGVNGLTTFEGWSAAEPYWHGIQYVNSGTTIENMNSMFGKSYELRYTAGVMYVYVDNVLKSSFSDVVLENLKLRIEIKTFDVCDIKYIETA